MSIEDLLKGLTGDTGANEQPAAVEPQAGDPLSGMLEGLLGGGGQGADPQQAASAGDPLSGMLEGLLGGGQQAGGMPAGGGGGMGDILGAILGGGGQQAGAGAGGLGGILGAILGGGGQQTGGMQAGSGGGMGDILGAILGGGGSGASGNSAASPLVDGLAAKLGIPPAIAQIIVSFVLSKLMGSLQQSGDQMPPAQGQGYQDMPQTPNLDGLLQQMGGDRHLAAELAQQTGLDPRTAMQGMQQVLDMIGSQAQAAQDQPAADESQPGGLDNLLRNW